LPAPWPIAACAVPLTTLRAPGKTISKAVQKLLTLMQDANNKDCPEPRVPASAGRGLAGGREAADDSQRTPRKTMPDVA
jgi:hypothetical protein